MEGCRESIDERKANIRRRIFISLVGLLAGCIGLAPLIFGIFGAFSLLIGWDKYSGYKENVASVSKASDCPFRLPDGAVDISYAYDMQFQGGAKICRFKLPEGNLQKAAWESFDTEAPAPRWNAITPHSPATHVSHRFDAPWFEPHEISDGWETATSGQHWEPRAWVNLPNRTVFLLLKN